MLIPSQRETLTSSIALQIKICTLQRRRGVDVFILSLVTVDIMARGAEDDRQTWLVVTASRHLEMGLPSIQIFINGDITNAHLCAPKRMTISDVLCAHVMYMHVKKGNYLHIMYDDYKSNSRNL